MKHYISKTVVEVGDGRVSGYEIVLTKPDALAATKNMFARMSRIGITNIHIVKHKAKRYNKLVRESNKRRKDRKMTKAEVAEILADDGES